MKMAVTLENEHIGATAGMVGHDISNPLQAMTGDLFLIKEELRADNADKHLIVESANAIEDNIVYSQTPC